MAVAWPVALAQKILRDGFQGAGDQNIKLRTSMQTGPAKIRLRYTSPVDVYRVSMRMSRTEFLDHFKPFYETSLAHGTLKFDALNPISMQTEEFRFVGTYQYSFIGWDTVTVSMQWEQVPHP